MHADRLADEDEAKVDLRHAIESGGDPLPLVRKWVISKRITRGRWNRLTAEVAGVEYRPPKPKTAIGKPGIGEGPGTELTKLSDLLKIPSCQCCKNLARRMNRWGVKGCKARREEIIAELRERQQKFGWGVHLKAAAMAAITGLAFQIDWTDPLPSIVDEAIRRAEKETAGYFLALILLMAVSASI